MWSSDSVKRFGIAACLCVAVAGLSACTARPLYADLSPTDGISSESLASLRGRIQVQEAGTRTDQIVRNALLSRLNKGARVADPIYLVRLSANGVERGITIETGGVPRSSIYALKTSFSLIRLADNQTVATGSREVIVPFDRTSQLFQSQRALLDAREQAGKEAAAQLEVTIAAALLREGV